MTSLLEIKIHPKHHHPAATVIPTDCRGEKTTILCTFHAHLSKRVLPPTPGPQFSFGFSV